MESFLLGFLFCALINVPLVFRAKRLRRLSEAKERDEAAKALEWARQQVDTTAILNALSRGKHDDALQLLEAKGARPPIRAEPNPHCGCHACNPNAAWFVACDACGNKRCPHAANHEHACANSNEPGQEGSVFK